MALTAEDILRALAALAEELERRNEKARIMVVGGAALVLLYRARESTKDIDAFFWQPEPAVLRDAVEAVATRLELPSDWLNDGAKGYIFGVSIGAVLYESKHLDVRAATTPQLLAMKLAAWRDAIDRGDAKLLLSDMEGSAEEIWSVVRPFIPPHQLDKASYAFEDLWEALHGPS